MQEKLLKTTNILLVIAIVILFFTNTMLNRRLRNIENSISTLHISHSSEASMTRHTLWNLYTNLNNLSEQLIQNTRSTFNENVQIQSYNAATTSADIEISFSLREHAPGDTVSVSARGQNTVHTAATAFANGHFIATMTLPVQDNYIFTFTTEGSTITTGELMQFNLANQLSGRFSYWLGHGHSWGTNQPTVYTFNPHFTNLTQGNPMLEINALHLTIEVDDTAIQTWDLMPYVQNSVNGQVLNMGWEGVPSISISDEPGNIPPGAHFVARLIIYDNLGIRYEQRDAIVTSHTASHYRVTGGAGGSASTTIPAPAREWVYRSEHEGWGFIQIVE